MKSYSVIGVMSGTSLDGVDLAHCQFSFDNHTWTFEIKAAITYPYSSVWGDKLQTAHQRSLESLNLLDEDYTSLLADYIGRFLREHELPPIDFIASHGHTVLHQPERQLTYQIGNLPKLAKLTGHKVICDFRVEDVALGGQGAPLVPLGDRLLFGDYEACINLGGFANISFESDDKRIAYDICPVNKVLNPYAVSLGVEFDEGGQIAKASVPNKNLLLKLDSLKYYSETAPKSLGIEWLEAYFFPLLESSGLSSEEIMATCTHHFAKKIADAIHKSSRVLFTGGGTLNSYVLELIASQTQAQLIVPDAKVIHYKEALIFALLGVLKDREEINVLASVTGASQDHSAGFIYLP
jgi:anhydro-N-acetylmuramic acid kinase